MKPVLFGAPLPPRNGSPHEWMEPFLLSAAKAENVEKMAVKPAPLGAPLPPAMLFIPACMPFPPHACTNPLESSAENA